MIGKRYGKLVVISASPVAGRQWRLRCDCGRTTDAAASHLARGSYGSCGNRGCKVGARPKHGKVGTPTYHIWGGMIQRCYNSANPKFYMYGAQGITVCEKWRSFVGFYEDMGERPSPGHSIDRIDGQRGYCPENVRWSTRLAQQRNLKSNRLLTYDGETRCLSEWAEKLGINKATLRHRLRSGRPMAEVLGVAAHGLGHGPKAKRITHLGQSLTPIEWAERLGISKNAIWRRMKAGWPIARALTPGDMRNQPIRSVMPSTG